MMWRGVAVRAEGRVLIEGCAAGLDGGGIYLIAPLELRPAAYPPAAAGGGGRSELVRNTAGRTGGGARALGALAAMTIASGAGLTMVGNSAGLDGGGLALAGGARLGAAAGRCPTAICPASLRGNGACDPECMTIGCNWCMAQPNLFNNRDSNASDKCWSAGMAVTVLPASPVPVPTRCRYATAQNALLLLPQATGAQVHQLAQGLAVAVAQAAAFQQRVTGGVQHVLLPALPSLPARSSTLLRWSRSVLHSALHLWSSSTAAQPSTLQHTEPAPTHSH
jgi:hypothetical protein